MCGKKIKKVLSVATLGLSDALLPDAPKAPDAPAGPAPAPTEQSAEVSAAREDERRRRAAAAGMSSTILTGNQGLAAPASTGAKTLLGS